MRQPETKYARSGDVHIAYQVCGEGPIDLVQIPPFVSHLEYAWEDPYHARFLERLSSFSRLIRFDKRGTGMSDRVAGGATLEERMDDVRAVLDAAGVERAALFGTSEGGPISILFAATYPQRATALILYATFLRGTRAPDYPWADTPEKVARGLEWLDQKWGTEEAVRGMLSRVCPTLAKDERYLQGAVNRQRRSASPGAAVALARMNAEIDVRHVLPAIHVPTLVLHRTADPSQPVEVSRYIVERIPSATLVELPGVDHWAFASEMDALVDEIQEFLTGVRPAAEPDRLLATVLFTDIVGSTERAVALGDRRWRELLEGHNVLIRRELERFRGREVNTAGDGFLATFDGPARAIRCACAASEAVVPLGLEIRAGLHTGECEVMGADVGGIAVHIGARVKDLAGPGEVLVSSTVKDLVAGSGIPFEGRGAHFLKGIPDEWRLFAVQHN